MPLRDYQLLAIEGLRAAIRRGKRSIILVSPTGSGKTTIAAEMVRSASARGKRTLFLAHRQELIDQCSARLDEIGLDHGIVMADHPRARPWLNVHVCSVPTLAKRERIPPADLVFIDECHRAAADSYLKVMNRYPGAVFIGLTATPCRLDDRGLGDLFQEMVECPSVADLTEMEYLVPARVFAPTSPDLKGVHIQQGDYKKDELAKAVDKPKLVGSIVEHWMRLAKGRQTVCFATSIQHSEHIRDEFLAAGVKCEHLDGKTEPGERRRLLGRFRDGETTVVTNVQVLTEGYDNPATGCVILARPTMSVSLYLQMAGRGLRPFPGKSEVIILDHAGATLQHGFVDDEREWSLDRSKRSGKDRDRAALSVRMCKECWCAYSSRLAACPACGAVHVRQAAEIQTVDGELTEITTGGKREPKISQDPAKAHFQKQRIERNERRSADGKPQIRAGWVHYRYQEFLAGLQSVPADVERRWAAYMRRTGRAAAVEAREAAIAARALDAEAGTALTVAWSQDLSDVPEDEFATRIAALFSRAVAV